VLRRRTWTGGRAHYPLLRAKRDSLPHPTKIAPAQARQVTARVNLLNSGLPLLPLIGGKARVPARRWRKIVTCPNQAQHQPSADVGRRPDHAQHRPLVALDTSMLTNAMRLPSPVLRASHSAAFRVISGLGPGVLAGGAMRCEIAQLPGMGFPAPGHGAWGDPRTRLGSVGRNSLRRNPNKQRSLGPQARTLSSRPDAHLSREWRQ
jgi:hypothetical protein